MNLSNNKQKQNLLQWENMHLEVARIVYKLLHKTNEEKFKTDGEYFIQRANQIREENNRLA